MKIILDTNIIISSLFWQGSPAKILERVATGKLTHCFTQSTFREFIQVLNYPKFRSEVNQLPFSIDDFLVKLSQMTIIYSDSRIKLNIIKDDPSDNKFLECALVAGAKYIISGDQHLLKLKEFQDIPIVSPQQFIKGLKQ